MDKSLEQKLIDLDGIKHWEIKFPFTAYRVNFDWKMFEIIVKGISYYRMNINLFNGELRKDSFIIYINGNPIRQHYITEELLTAINAVPLNCLLEIEIKKI